MPRATAQKYQYQVDDCKTWRRAYGCNTLNQAIVRAQEYGEFVIWDLTTVPKKIIKAYVSDDVYPSCPGGLPEECKL